MIATAVTDPRVHTTKRVPIPRVTTRVLPYIAEIRSHRIMSTSSCCITAAVTRVQTGIMDSF